MPSKRRTQDKPIFLSVGYSTFYWCHVMKRKVFDDPAIAEESFRYFGRPLQRSPAGLTQSLTVLTKQLEE